MSAVAEASPSIRARDNLSALGLHEMAAALPDYVRMVAAGERDFCSALEEMTRVEVAAREARIVRQRIRSPGFPYVKGLADFDWDFQPSVPRTCCSWAARASARPTSPWPSASRPSARGAR